MTSKERNIKIYKSAINYLEQITPEGIDLDYYYSSDTEDVRSMEDLFRRFILSAQNYQQMPNVIAFQKRETEISELLYDNNLEKISKLSYDDLYSQFRKAFNVTSADTKHNSWYKWSCSVIDSARFLIQFKTVKDFDTFVKGFDYNPLSQIALPLLIQSQIKGIGFALACDLLKELGYENYPKPDVHILDVFTELNLCENNQMAAFLTIRQMADDCKETDTTVTAYKIDKIFWLICSGFYYNENPPVRIKRHKKEFIQYMKGIISY